MSAGLRLRALVSARLTAVADEIFALFEKTVAEYEDELRRTQENRLHRDRAAPNPEKRHVEPVRRDGESGKTDREPGTKHGAGVLLVRIRSDSPQIKQEPEELSVSYADKEEEQRPQEVSVSATPQPEKEKAEVSADMLFYHTNAQTQPEDDNTHFYVNAKEQERHPEVSVCVREEPEMCRDNTEAQFYDFQQETEADEPRTNTTHTETNSENAGGDFFVKIKEEDMSLDAHFYNFHTDTGTHFDNTDAEGDWAVPFGYSDPLLETEDYSQTILLRKHQCPLCLKVFANRSHLQRHSTVHSGEKPFSCSVCGKSFNTKSYLVVHMRSHTGERPYSCSFCQRSFSHKSAFNFHVQTHSTEKPYSCSVCGKSFTVETYLKVHMKTHSSDRPFCCSICGARFGRSNSLSSHMKTHLSDKAFFCNVCGRSFTYKHNLDLHQRTHHPSNQSHVNHSAIQPSSQINRAAVQSDTLMNHAAVDSDLHLNHAVVQSDVLIVGSMIRADTSDFSPVRGLGP